MPTAGSRRERVDPATTGSSRERINPREARLPRPRIDSTARGPIHDFILPDVFSPVDRIERAMVCLHLRQHARPVGARDMR